MPGLESCVWLRPIQGGERGVIPSGRGYNCEVVISKESFQRYGICPNKNPDVLVIKAKVFDDPRGFFLETYRENEFVAAGVDYKFVQENHSASQRGVLRGLHYQIRQTQGKLVRAIAGEIFDAVVDIRRSSPTFGQWVGVILSAENKNQLWVPPGFAHGFYVLSERAEITYKVTDYYAPEWDRSLLWNDPKIGVEWPLVDDAPVLSNKDINGKPFAEADLFD
ncbi:MAG: dTDP-4-dehydrorhamnose 3,5-epimerase [Anaerolineales bacterium]|nr:dTDP-4-dehydrorhamnose 3,5-epimerase [Anaerolineales bacterium]